MDIGDVVIVQQGNPYHEWEIREWALRKRIGIRRVEWSEKSIRRFRYSGILDEKEVLWLVVGKQEHGIKEELLRMKRKKRIIIVEVETREQRNWVKKLKVGGVEPTHLPLLLDWEEKEEKCIKMVGEFRIKCKSAEVQKKLIGMMIREPESWSDVKLTAGVLQRDNQKFDMDVLQNIYPDMDFYRLDDWMKDVIEGIKKQKSIKVAHYFRHTKGYSNVWLMKKLRERVEQLSLVFDAYRKGIVYVEVSKSQLLERSKVAGFSKGAELAGMKKSDRMACLRLVKELPYEYFIHVQKVLFRGDEVVAEDWDIYRYIEELRKERGMYDARQGDGTGSDREWKKRNNRAGK